jgi:hypothetical protein
VHLSKTQNNKRKVTTAKSTPITTIYYSSTEYMISPNRHNNANRIHKRSQSNIFKQKANSKSGRLNKFKVMLRSNSSAKNVNRANNAYTNPTQSRKSKKDSKRSSNRSMKFKIKSNKSPRRSSINPNTVKVINDSLVGKY